MGEVAVASSVRQALEAIEAAPPDFAFMDVNLGNETSFPIADALAANTDVRVAVARLGRARATLRAAGARVPQRTRASLTRAWAAARLRVVMAFQSSERWRRTAWAVTPAAA